MRVGLKIIQPRVKTMKLLCLIAGIIAGLLEHADCCSECPECLHSLPFDEYVNVLDDLAWGCRELG